MSSQQRTLLIVDDSPEDRELYRRYLQRDREHDYIFLEASSGQQGLALWQQQPDAVLLDYRLPDLDGLEFLAQLSPPTLQPCLPVIIVTGQGNETVAVQAIKAGAQDYLIKEQITPEGLQLVVNGAIETVQLRSQLQQRIERDRLISQTTQKIYQTLDLDEILQTTVTEVRQFLQTDRVLIYRLQADDWGTVVKEAVGAEWRPLLGSSLHDPCIHRDYVEPFRQGLVTLKSDIHDGSIAPCHVELLTKLQVRANLVVPILQNGYLWGMLIAHHCAAPRQWQPLEVELLKELAVQVGIALRQAELYQQAQDELTERRRIETELRASEEFKRRILNSSSDCINLLDINGQFLYINKGGLRLLEIDDFTLYLNQAWLHLWPDSDRPAAETALATAKAGELFRFQGFRPTVKGTPKWWDVAVTPILDATGQVSQILAISRDITDQKQAETELKVQQTQLQQQLAEIEAIYQSAPIGLNVLDTDLRFIRINQRLAEMNGYSIDAHLGRSLREILPDLADTAEQLLHTILETGEPLLNVELRGETPAQPGVARIWLEHFLPLKHGDRVVGISTVCEEITDRKQVEDALRQSEERYRCLAELIPQLVWTANVEGQLLDVNQRWSAFTGLTLEHARDMGWQAVVHPDDIPGLLQQWSEAVQQDIPYQAEGRMRRADGQYRWHLHQAVSQRNQQGEIIRWFGTATDIEPQKQLEVEREQLLQREQNARLESERANRVKDEFLAILSHELRSPLNPILGWTKLLQTRNLDATKTAEALATIERNVKLQTQLIDDLLDIAKILRGKLSINAVPVDLTVVIESALETVCTAAVSKSILLRSVLPNIGQVSGDTNRLQQIIWNLLSNAIKFTPQGGQVEVYLERVDHYAQIVVSDTGKGISPDFLPHIFESFRQEDVSITRTYGGLGLGLAIVRQLVEAHGGMIQASSPGEGQGATFTVQLPMLNPTAAAQLTDERSYAWPDLTGIRILTVDDDADARDLITIILDQAGADVLTVHSAADLLANLEAFQPDLLISDIGMPEVDGYTLIQQIRTLPAEQGGQVPAIALTAYAREVDQQRAIRSGYQQHVTKPIEPDQLLQAVVRLVQRHSLESSNSSTSSNLSDSRV